MEKKVNLYCRVATTIDGMHFSGNIYAIDLPIEVIRKCLLAHIRVEEIKDDGSIIELGFDNFDKTTESKSVIFIDDEAPKLPKFTIDSYDAKGNKILPKVEPVPVVPSVGLVAEGKKDEEPKEEKKDTNIFKKDKK